MKRFALIALAIILSLPANAQFGNLLNKAKNAAKGAAKTAIREEKKEVKEEAAKAIQETVEETTEAVVAPAVANEEDQPLYLRTFTPSAEAQAVDSFAMSTKINDGFTRSIKDIHATYEHLGDPDIYIYQPYYKYPLLYVLSDSDQELIDNSFNQTAVALFLSLARNDGGYYMPITPMMMDGMEVNIPIDEYCRHAWTVQYIADPTSSMAFINFAKTLIFKEPQVIAVYQFPMDDPNKGIIKADKGWILPVNFMKAREARMYEALTLAINVLDISIVTQYLEQLYGLVGTSGSYYNLLYLMMGNAMYDNVYVQHKDYDANSTQTRKIDMLKMKAGANIGDMYETLRLRYAEEVEMPKGVSVDGTTQAKGTAAAKDFAKDEFVKVIFLRSSWEEYKEFTYPYRTTSFAMPVAVITKSGDKYFTQTCDLQKSPDGSRWYVSASTAKKQPVKSN